MAEDTQADKPQAPEDLVGHADGEILHTPDGDEKVVYDYDDEKNFIGWHKVPVKG